MTQNTPQQAAPGRYELTAGQRRYLKIKRVLDTVTALILLAVLAIPMGIIALIQKVESPHEPVLFHHQRIGKDGQPFELLKFRSMKSTAPEYRASAGFEEREKFITGFGRFLRNTSLDELPQLFLVVSGKMALIGPRPLIPQEAEVHRLREAAGVYQLRPGLTGWAQINGRDKIADEEKAARDREYLEHVSFAWDWKIFWMSITKVVSQENAG